MFRSLRSKLVLSHLLVILMAFFLTVAIASVPIRRAQATRVQTGLALSAESVARQIDLTRQLGRDGELVQDSTQMDFTRRMVDAERRRSGNRILVIDASGTVMLDSSPARSLEGETFPQFARSIERISQQIGPSPLGLRLAARVALSLETYSVAGGQIDDRNSVVAGSAATSLRDRTNFYAVAIAPRSAAPIIDDIIRPLAFAALIGAAISILVALLLARIATRPLRELTRTATGITAGDLDRRVEMQEGGEVGTLVSAFNAMLDRLASTYQSQRDLLANIAHELRTPLTSVQGYAQALRDGVITRPEERENALVAITEETLRMTSLVEQILQLSRLESGQLPLMLQTVRIGDLFAQLGRQFDHVASERDVELSIDPSDDLELQADPELLVQAIGNLTSNAIRHTPAGGKVEVRATRIASADRPPGIRITVTDTGEGIEQEQLERLFERFYRGGDHALSRDGRNFGLGLAIVHEVVERHNGQISIESALGRGTVATIDLPVDHPSRAPSARP